MQKCSTTVSSYLEAVPFLLFFIILEYSKPLDYKDLRYPFLIILQFSKILLYHLKKVKIHVIAVQDSDFQHSPIVDYKSI